MMSTGLMDLKDGAMMKNEGMDGRELYLTSFYKSDNSRRGFIMGAIMGYVFILFLN